MLNRPEEQVIKKAVACDVPIKANQIIYFNNNLMDR